VALYHRIEVKKGILSLEVYGRQLEIDLKQISPVFRKANSDEFQKFELSPSGYGIHLPLLDEDVSIDGLLGIVHSPKDNKFLDNLNTYSYCPFAS
jgi:hypothetical protein